MSEATKFQKILEHPECDKIIGKLINGEPAKEVANFLKVKYHKDDESNLRISASVLTEFLNKYVSQYESIHQIIKAEEEGKLNTKVAESLLNNETWRDRLAKVTDDEIDILQKMKDVIHLIEARAEQVFDFIQENPGKTKSDYVLIKYLEQLFGVLEKYDKIKNHKPDQVIQHNISVQMVQDHSMAFQQAIKEALSELDPEVSFLVLDKINDKLNKMKDISDSVPQQSYEERMKEIKDYVPSMEAMIVGTEDDLTEDEMEQDELP